MPERTLRGKVAIAGIGETTYYKHGQSPDAEFKLALQAIVNACRHAGGDPRGVGAGGARWPMPVRPGIPAVRPASSPSAPWRKASSPATAAATRRRPSVA